MLDNSSDDQLPRFKTLTIAKPDRSALVRETAFNLALLSARRISFNCSLLSFFIDYNDFNLKTIHCLSNKVEEKKQNITRVQRVSIFYS